MAYDTIFGNSKVFMRLIVCGYQYVFLSQECWMENSSITPCRRSPQRKKPSFPQMLERVTWPITLHSWFLSESRLHRLFFSFSIKAFRENLLPRDSPLVHLCVMLFCAGCFKMRYEFDDSFTLWFDLTMHLQGPFAIYVLYNCCLMLCIPRSEDILLLFRLCELMVISDQPIRWWVHSMYFSADRAPKVYIRLSR